MRIKSKKRHFATEYVALARTNNNFRYLWLAQSISQFGDWFNLIASASLVAMLFHNVKKRMHGRIFSTEFALLTLMNALGTVWGGLGLDNSILGIRSLLIIMSALTLIFGAFWTVLNISNVKKPAHNGK